MTPSTIDSLERPDAADVADAWPALYGEERLEAFSLLGREQAEDLFFTLSSVDQVDLVLALPQGERRSWLRLLPPDDAADFVQAAARDRRDELLALLDDQTRREVKALLIYADDVAGGLMSPRYARLRPDMNVDEALAYLRRQARTRLETINYAYVLDEEQRLIGVVSLKQLFRAQPTAIVRDLMKTELVTVVADMDQEAVSRLFQRHDFTALPVIDQTGRMQGVVTADDIVHVVQEEATEDIQKMGGSEALDAPYSSVGFWPMVKKRGGWLSALFLGEMLTATAMAYFEDEIAKAVVLALFVPLIISSGGNSGSQASTILVRALALGEVRLSQWWRVARREVMTGVVLGCLLGTLGALRILVWQAFTPTYGPHYLLVAGTVSASLIGVVTFGTVAGSMLPFVLRKLGFDPASASAPFIATLVDVSGLVIYFTVASAVMGGVVL